MYVFLTLGIVSFSKTAHNFKVTHSLSKRIFGEIVFKDNDNLPGHRREDLFERIFSEGKGAQTICHFETTATDRRI